MLKHPISPPFTLPWDLLLCLQEIKTRAASMDAVHEFVRTNLPNAQQEESFSGFLSYQLEITDTELAQVCVCVFGCVSLSLSVSFSVSLCLPP